MNTVSYNAFIRNQTVIKNLIIKNTNWIFLHLKMVVMVLRTSYIIAIHAIITKALSKTVILATATAKSAHLPVLKKGLMRAI